MISFFAVAFVVFAEHIADHKNISSIIEKDLLREPGLHRTLMGDGVASMIGTWICGLPNTSYGESTATIGFSRVASVIVSTVAALFLGSLAFIEPVQVFLRSIPSCVFGGCAMILYGYIACSGLKTIIRETINNEDKTSPVPDDALTEILNKKGYKIARRTVAKYREQLNIPVARLRREL